jgi:hypothetical protein
MAAAVPRPNVQHPQRVPLGGLPAVWCSGARLRSLSTNTQASWKMCSFVWPGWTGPSIDWLRCVRERRSTPFRTDGCHCPTTFLPLSQSRDEERGDGVRSDGAAPARRPRSPGDSPHGVRPVRNFSTPFTPIPNRRGPQQARCQDEVKSPPFASPIGAAVCNTEGSEHCVRQGELATC